MTIRLDLILRGLIAPFELSWMAGRYAWEYPRRAGIFACVCAVLCGLTLLVGPHEAAGVVSWLCVLAVLWFVLHSRSRRWARHRLKCRWVQWKVYERDGSWSAATREAGLSNVQPKARDTHPPIVRTEVDAFGHTLWVNKLYGQTVRDWQRASESLRQAFGARTCRVFEDEHPLFRVEFARGPDPLEQTIPALPILEDVDFSAVPIGLTERGKPWTLDVRLHILLAGKTKAGKSSALWSLIRALCPAIKAGLVEVHAIDPKGGIELGFGEELFAGYEDRDIIAMARMLGDAVTEMDKRLRRLKKEGMVRLHTPTLDEPLVLLVIDEFATVSDYVGTDQASRQLSNQIKANIRTILNQGRAAGFVMIGALQDPRIEVLPMRNSFPHRIAFRMETRDETDMILGDSARERGAECHEIPVGMPGVAFMLVDGESEFTRVRSAYVTDAEIRDMAERYAPERKPVPVDPKVAAVLGRARLDTLDTVGSPDRKV